MIKIVITAAGKGTRLLPFTKELPKEMMPIFTKNSNKEILVTPLLQFIFQQLYSIGIRDYCFVVGREKRSIEDHFTPHYEYLKELSGKKRNLISSFYKKISNSHIVWMNQNRPLGFGDAVRRTERYVGKNSLIVHAGDVSIIGKSKPPVLRLIDVAERDPTISAVLLCKKIKNSKGYGVPSIRKLSNSTFLVTKVEEKPLKPKSNLGLLPLYYFKPKIFECLRKLKPGKGNEIQLTDAIQKLIEQDEKVVAIPLNNDEIEIDVGNVESYKRALEISYKEA